MYNHGNDSGWDNASIFHEGVPVESPDLAAHLIRQIDILSDMAVELGLMDEAKKWSKTADEMYVITSYSIHYTKLYEGDPTQAGGRR